MRASQSLWQRLGPGVEERIVARLGDALASGEWDAEHGRLRERADFDGSLRIVIAELDVED